MSHMWTSFTSSVTRHFYNKSAPTICAVSWILRHGAILSKNSRISMNHLHTCRCNSLCRNTNNEGSWQLKPADVPKVDLGKMTVEEQKIHFIHEQACKAGQRTYIDPATGYTVLTRLFHIKKGKCCGNACRHCAYNHIAVPEEHRTKKFNSSFYV